MKRALVFLALCLPAFAISVTTGQYDNTRSGVNTSESVLTQTTVASNKFQKLWSYSYTGYAYASPLILQGVLINGASRDVLFIASNQNYLYAFDANSVTTFWSLGPAYFGVAYEPGIINGIGPDGANTHSFAGIIGTPVIDPATNVIYLVSSNASGVNKLYALNAADGSEFHSPVVISATAQGETFISAEHMNRPALLLLANKIYAAFGTYGDTATAIDPAAGWVISYDKTTLVQATAWTVNTGVGTYGGGIWMSGGGLSSDGTSIYMLTGSVPNGASPCATGYYGESFVKVSQALVLADFMRPANCQTLNMNDQDLGSSRALYLALAGGNYVVGIGKSGKFYSLNAAAMGSIEGSGPPINQQYQLGYGEDTCFNCFLYAYGVFYYANGAMLNQDKVRAFTMGTDGKVNTTATAISADYANWQTLAYSSNGPAAGTGILWVSSATANLNMADGAGILRALNPTTLATIWQSSTFLGDALGNSPKFVPPVIANGKVYQNSFSGVVDVYGLITPTAVLQ